MKNISETGARYVRNLAPIEVAFFRIYKLQEEILKQLGRQMISVYIIIYKHISKISERYKECGTRVAFSSYI